MSGFPAGIVKSSSGGVSLSQLTEIVIAPCLPAAGPVIVFSTSSEPTLEKTAWAPTVVWRSVVCARISFCALVTPGEFPL